MAFERNDIVNKTRLMGELGEELMGYEHNDIVTVDVMNKAIEEGGGGGGGGDYPTATVTFINSAENTYYIAYVPHLADGVITQEGVQVDAPADVQIPLGENGTALLVASEGVSFFDNVDWDTAPVFTGDIEALIDHGAPVGFKVTGDGTITLKGTGH